MLFKKKESIIAFLFLFSCGKKWSTITNNLFASKYMVNNCQQFTNNDFYY